MYIPAMHHMKARDCTRKAIRLTSITRGMGGIEQNRERVKQ